MEIDCYISILFSATATVGLKHLIMCDGKELQLNRAQSRAVRLYADADGPRVFCILSPPGSGKTTVAAAMAAEVFIAFFISDNQNTYSFRTYRTLLFVLYINSSYLIAGDYFFILFNSSDNLVIILLKSLVIFLRNYNFYG